MNRLDLSPTGRTRVVLGTVAGTLVCMLVAVIAVTYTTPLMPPAAQSVTWALAFALPIVLSAPIFYVLLSKLRELAIAHRQLTVLASQDSLTSCLNRGAFVTLVDAYLSQVNSRAPVSGSLLIIDADHFKAINDHHGHAAGDAALKVLAAAIKSELRTNDLVGRVGGEEFAVFLPLADQATATLVAERIRARIATHPFDLDDTHQTLSVSVGGTVFEGQVGFDELFVAADARLYEAKKNGRNRVVLERFSIGRHQAPSTLAPA